MEHAQRLAGGNILVRKGIDPEVLVITFNSGFQYLGMRSNEFELSALAEAMGCSRIHCKDPRFLWYHAGFDDDHPDIRSSIRLLQEIVASLAPQVLITTGASAGGYMALLCGHFLRASYVHALGPNTCLTRTLLGSIRSKMQPAIWKQYERLWACPSAAADLFDLAPVLEKHNGHTRYCVHYCASAEKDVLAAQYVRHVPGFELFPHACQDHYIAVHMAKAGLLGPVLRPEMQAHLHHWLAPRLERNEGGV